ncbi:MAG: lipid A export permease/ATP-binding protein MsbA [Methylophilaceae bacterium]|nr:lipid A export permease/ATP-binding protein MsbA [Methylophilaceae bacterium]MBL6726670.1 lipid A export permease/ATP-binding protein MsbA [Methylophilaceae bacterium]MBL6728860.1 lipid A export permease/ATP-binding protein MsbA [Methylophilaceae bacterium]MBL6790906.1 lipid A export permease/ATP-binding protein MsbA [Methylophilaceae bacterium]
MSEQKATKLNDPGLIKTYKRLITYSLKYKSIIFLSICSLLVFAASNTGFLALLKKITDEGLVEKNQEAIVFLPIALILLSLVRALSGFSSSYSLKWVSRKVVEDLRFDVFKNILTLPISFFDSHPAGNIVSKLTYETEQLAYVVVKVALDSLKDFLTLLGVIGYMFYLDWILTLMTISMIPIIAFYLKKISPKLRSTGKEIQETMGNMTQVSEEVITSQKIVRIFNAGLYELKRFSFFSERNRKMHTRLAKLSSGNSSFVEVISGLVFALIVFYAFQNFTAGEFTAFIAALLMLIGPIKKLTNITEQIQVGHAAATSVFKVMDEEKEKNSGHLKIKKIKGDIEFQNVSFLYPGSKKKVLDNVSFQISAGQKIALVGKSGGGKSTLVNLLPLFYQYQSGKILIDNKDIREYRIGDLREQMALVTQEITLFNDTVKSNIAYGKRVGLDRIRQAAIAANASEFIDQLEKKYDHMIGDRGVKLSGGQKQRIAIARAIIKNAPILLLDEATSALDSESEKYVQKALDFLMKNRTSIVIAHRLSTVRNADKIIVVDSGKIVEEGTHESLVKRKGYYEKLYKKGFD